MRQYLKEIKNDYEDDLHSCRSKRAKAFLASEEIAHYINQECVK